MNRSTVETGYIGSSPARQVVKAERGAPANWVRKGVGDIRRSPFGSTVFAIGLTVTLYFGSLLLNSTVFLGFAYTVFVVIAATLFAGGLLALSRQSEAGGGSVKAALSRLWQAKFHLVLLSLTVSALIMGWKWLSLLIAKVASGPIPSGRSLLSFSQSVDGIGASAVLLALALLFTIMLFYLLFLSLPMVVDGEEEIINALIISYLACTRNAGATLTWLAGASALVAVAVALWFPILAFLLAVMIHSSWHGYRSMVA